MNVEKISEGLFVGSKDGTFFRAYPVLPSIPIEDGYGNSCGSIYGISNKGLTAISQGNGGLDQDGDHNMVRLEWKVILVHNSRCISGDK